MAARCSSSLPSLIYPSISCAVSLSLPPLSLFLSLASSCSGLFYSIETFLILSYFPAITLCIFSPCQKCIYVLFIISFRLLLFSSDSFFHYVAKRNDVSHLATLKRREQWPRKMALAWFLLMVLTSLSSTSWKL